MKSVKTTMLDYLDWRGDLSFVNDPINEVDFLVFSTLAYVDFSPAPFVNSLNPYYAPTLAEAYDSLKSGKQGDAEFMKLFEKCANSKRFSNVEVFAYESVIEESSQLQFSAVSFMLDNSQVVIAYRGTDDTIIGWKEDLIMSYEQVPAQSLAKLYADKIAKACEKSDFYLTGHSKGGNLAVWAGAYLDEKYSDRLLKIFDNDGPGFCTDITKSEEFQRIEEKAVKYVVDSSVIGMFLNSETKRRIVASNEASTLMQHYPMSWLVVGNKFHCLEHRSKIAQTTELVISRFTDSLSFEERKLLTHTIFDIVSSSNIKSVSQLRGPDAVSAILPMLKAYAETDKEKKQFILSIIGRLTKILKEETINKKTQ